MLRDYELTFIVNPGMEENELSAFSDKVKQWMKEKGGEVVRMESWGKRKLAHRIKNKKEGYYVFTEVKGTGETVKETERFLKLQEDVIRYLFVQKEEEKKEEQTLEEASGEAQESGKSE